MFYYFHGEIALLDTNLAVIDCGGVGYACHTTAYTQSRLKIGQRAKLYVYESIREDAHDLYGFGSRDELQCFELLLSVSGVGPKAALSILSATTPSGFQMAILMQDEKVLTSAPGIGKKIAQRILLELKDKLAGQTFTDAGMNAAAASVPPQGTSGAEAAQALAALGYSSQEIAASLKGIDVEHLKTEEIVRLALRNMVLK